MAAVAGHSGQYPTLASIIPALVIHGVCDILGITFIGLALRYGKKLPVSAKQALP